ncbi:hypothetical protein [Roseofilum sp. Guam]|uniref:hypothetical protein n=1 Tax=Roseofilum sp. Guam TaxID=2821502 RepID=UPI001B1A7F3C|nr:hypothetical protein [Roseofilum sp. Guam]MBP0031140.1 hypothetical protein [Roseofilum sp. Guam]
MSIQKIPLASIQKIRTYLTSLLVLPESENCRRSLSFNESDDLPEPESLDELGGLFDLGPAEEDEEAIATSPSGPWLISAVNPATALRKLPGLRLKLGLRWVSYIYRDPNEPNSGTGITWAVPEDYCATATLEEALADGCDPEHPPRPQGALDNFMAAIEGDRSAPSFMVATLLRREIQEFVRAKANRDWSYHRLIDSPPKQVKWQWKGQIKDLSPKIRKLDDGKIAVEFFTCRTSAPIAIFRHVEQYPSSSYQSKAIDQPVAIPIRTKSIKN